MCASLLSGHIKYSMIYRLPGFCFQNTCNIAVLVYFVNSLRTEMKIAEFPNSVDLDEVAHDEPPHLDLHCFPSSL